MKEHKKLYKAKKNWIIGMIAGMAIVFGGGINANADTDTNSQEGQHTTSPINFETKAANTTQEESQGLQQDNPALNNDHISLLVVNPVKTTQGTNDNTQNERTNNKENDNKPVAQLTNNGNQQSNEDGGSSDIHTTNEDDYPNKATIFGNSYDDDDYEKVSPKNVAVPKANDPNDKVVKDTDTVLMPPILRGHYTTHISPHQMLYSKEITRNGQHYIVGIATEAGGTTFLTYLRNNGSEIIGDGDGVYDGPYFVGGYYGISYDSSANIKWNDHEAVAFGTATYDSHTLTYNLFNHLQIKTTVKTSLQSNGVINYIVTWQNQDEHGNVPYERDEGNDEEPFSFNLGNMTNKGEYQKQSPIWKIGDDLYANYIVINDKSGKPQYIIQFIKVKNGQDGVMSQSYNSCIEDYEVDIDGRDIPGINSFIPKGTPKFKGMFIFSPTGEGKTVKAFKPGQSERSINFKRVFMNADELKGMTSQQIIQYVNNLFEGKKTNKINNKDTYKVNLVFKDIANHKIVFSQNVISKTPYLNFGLTGLDLSKTVIYLGKNGDTYLNDKKHNLLYKVVNPSQYGKVSVTSQKLQNIFVEPVVDLDQEDIDFVLGETGLDTETFNNLKDIAKKAGKAFNIFEQAKKVKDKVEEDDDNKYYGKNDKNRQEYRKEKNNNKVTRGIGAANGINKVVLDINNITSENSNTTLSTRIMDWTHTISDIKDDIVGIINNASYIFTKPLQEIEKTLKIHRKTELLKSVSKKAKRASVVGGKIVKIDDKAMPFASTITNLGDVIQSESVISKDNSTNYKINRKKAEKRIADFKKNRNDRLTMLEKVVTFLGGIIGSVATATGVGIPLATAITGILSVGGAAILAVGLWHLLSKLLPADLTDKNLLSKFKLTKK